VSVAARVQRYGATAAHSVNLSRDAAEKWEVVPIFRTPHKVAFRLGPLDAGTALHNEDARGTRALKMAKAVQFAIDEFGDTAVQ
jgi:hypothetical protein